MGLFNGLIDWTTKVFAPLGPLGLFVLAIIESIFFPIPPDFLLIILALANPEKALFFALITTLGSIVGGIMGYKLGQYGGLPILKKLFKEKQVKKMHELYEKHQTITIAIAGFTPIPYKVFALTAGAFYINLKKFVIVSTISRGARFFIVASLIMFYGVSIQNYIDKYFNMLTLVTMGITGVGYIIYKKYKK